jgi:hypothetical protein
VAATTNYVPHNGNHTGSVAAQAAAVVAAACGVPLPIVFLHNLLPLPLGLLARRYQYGTSLTQCLVKLVLACHKPLPLQYRLVARRYQCGSGTPQHKGRYHCTCGRHMFADFRRISLAACAYLSLLATQ